MSGELIKVQSQLVQKSNNLVKHLNNLLPSNKPELIPYRKGDKWGYCDKNKYIELEPRFEETGCFSCGLAWVKVNNTWFIIDRDFKFISDTGYEYIKPFYKDIAFASSVNYYDGAVINKASNKINLNKELEIEYVTKFFHADTASKIYYKNLDIDTVNQEQLIIEENNNPIDRKYAILNKNNKISEMEIRNHVFLPFGLIGISTGYNRTGWKVIDYNGKVIIPGSFYKIEPFFNFLLCTSVFSRSKESFMFDSVYDWSGKELVKSNYYNAIIDYNEGMFLVNREDETGWNSVRVFGFVNEKNEEVIKCKYLYCNRFSEGLAGVIEHGYNKKYGYIDEVGVEIISQKYERVNNFYLGLAKVQLDNKWGYIDKSGTEYWED